jgi:hypothetical protein
MQQNRQSKGDEGCDCNSDEIAVQKAGENPLRQTPFFVFCHLCLWMFIIWEEWYEGWLLEETMIKPIKA